VSAANKAKETYLLSGLINCGDCNGAMVGNRKFAGRNKTLYVTERSGNKKTKARMSKSALSMLM